MRRKQVQRQCGVVLIMSLIMLVIVSLLATMSMKGALSSESISGSVRLNQLAHQSAEAALRFCEDAVVKTLGGKPVSGFSIQPQFTSLRGNSTTLWDDATNAAVYALALNAVNNNGQPYKRPPECIAEQLAPAGSPKADKLIAITARGFGPEVPALPTGTTDRRPAGSEVFLQSTLELE